MKRNVIIKIFLDVTMVILYLLLMFAKGLGGFFHETIGIGIGILFIIHVLLNCSMIKGLFRSVKGGNPGKTVLLVSDIILTICMPVVIVTGIIHHTEGKLVAFQATNYTPIRLWSKEKSVSFIS